jgi:hypothetical protein
VRAQAKRGSHHNLIKDARRSVDDELAAACGAHNAPQISCIYLGDGNRASFAQKAAGTFEVTVTAPDSVSLTLEEFCKKGAGCAGPENEDPHGVAKTLSQSPGRA